MFEVVRPTSTLKITQTVKLGKVVSANYVLSLLLLFVSLFLLTLATKSYADEGQSGRFVHYTLEYPPYWQIDNNQLTGLHYRMSKVIYEAAKLDVDFMVLPYARIVSKISEKQTQLFAYGAENKSPDHILYPIPPTVISLRAYSILKTPPKSIHEFEGSRIAVIRGFPLHHFSKILDDDKFTTVQLNNIDSALSFLLKGRADYLITLHDPFLDVMSSNRYNSSKFYDRELYQLDGYPIVINKHNPHSKLLFNKIQQAYIELTKQGVLTYKNKRLLLSDDTLNNPMPNSLPRTHH